uniref:S-Me-THD-like C-terminal domain-containing protein n=1 Tax=Alexandrium catenella TaxID=2925 RepID=A0A7S1PQ55_ALECA
MHGQRPVAVEFQNEFLIARDADSVVLGSVPDLLCLVETATGRPIATEEVRYGLRVSLLCLPAPPQLRTEAALREVSPGAFGYAGVAYEPVGEYVPPLSVPRMGALGA